MSEYGSMSRGQWCLVVFAVTGVGVGCVRDNAAMTEEQFCQDYARAECSQVASFCSASAEACEPVRVAACREAAGRLKGVGHEFNPGNTDRCLKKVKEAYATLPIYPATLKAVDDTCARVFAGTARAVEPCVVDYDCVEGLICDKGRCGTEKIVAANAGCANIGERCPHGEYCSNEATGFFMCTQRLTEGMACAATRPCAEELRCRSTCVSRLPAGQPCAIDDDCLTGYCTRYVPNPTCGGGLTFSPGAPSCTAYTTFDDGGVAGRGPNGSMDAADASTTD
jgi:hypothetical protein